MTILAPKERLAVVPTGSEPMTVAEFLAWDGFDHGHRYQLIDGTIVMMTPTLGNHNVLVSALSRELGVALKGTRFRVFVLGGVARSRKADRWFEADVMVTAEPGNLRFYSEPLLVAEVLSPSTEDLDRRIKLPDYRRLPSVGEILLLDQFRPYVEVHRRPTQVGGEWTVALLTDLGDTLELVSLPLRLPLSDLYEGVTFGPPPADEWGGADT